MSVGPEIGHDRATGELGCSNQTPREVFMEWFSDTLDSFRENGIGLGLWDFRGSIGILNSGSLTSGDVLTNHLDVMKPGGGNYVRNTMGDRGPMPLNNKKVYGQGGGTNTAAGTEKEAVERFWRNVFGGAASTCLHRPGGRDP